MVLNFSANFREVEQDQLLQTVGGSWAKTLMTVGAVAIGVGLATVAIPGIAAAAAAGSVMAAAGIGAGVFSVSVGTKLYISGAVGALLN